MVASVLVLAGCPAGGEGHLTGAPPSPPDVQQPGTDTSTSTASTGSDTTGSGSDTDEGLCPGCGAGFCAAEVDADAGPAVDGVGNYQCRAECVPTHSSSLWCGSDQSCCEAAAVCCRPGSEIEECTADRAGYCILLASDTDGESSSAETTSGTSESSSSGS